MSTVPNPARRLSAHYTPGTATQPAHMTVLDDEEDMLVETRPVSPDRPVWDETLAEMGYRRIDDWHCQVERNE